MGDEQHRPQKSKQHHMNNNIRRKPPIQENQTLETLQRTVKEGCLINGWRLQQMLGAGSFGFIHLGKREGITGGNHAPDQVAVKFEVNDPRGRHAQLQNEFTVYQALHNQAGFPKVFEYRSTTQYNYMTMQLMGENLETLMKEQGGELPRFSLKTVLLIADQLLNLIEKLHEIGYIHRDIKPENIMIGADQENRHRIHLLDMGLAKRYVNPLTKEHLGYQQHTSLSGTARYTSINSHLGIEQTRRDDLESLVFVLIYMACGKLPWQGFKGNRETKYQLIERAKLQLDVEQMCQGLDSEFAEALKYCRGLQYHEEPDYEHLRKLFQRCARRNGYSHDFRYDWSAGGKPKSTAAAEVKRPAVVSKKKNKPVAAPSTRRPTHTSESESYSGSDQSYSESSESSSQQSDTPIQIPTPRRRPVFKQLGSVSGLTPGHTYTTVVTRPKSSKTMSGKHPVTTASTVPTNTTATYTSNNVYGHHRPRSFGRTRRNIRRM